MRFLGERAPDYVLEAMRRGRTAGVILFGDNATHPAGTKALTRRLRSADADALIATDQEGGTIRILGWARPAARPVPRHAAGGGAGSRAWGGEGARATTGSTSTSRRSRTARTPDR